MTNSSTTPPSSSWKSHFPDGDLWVFGYGGDHRGTPDSPGRVVTVIERSFWETLSDPQASLEQSTSPTHTTTSSAVWGAAYHIPATHAEQVHAYLDDREIDGYSVHFTPFHPSSSSSPIPTNTNTNTSTNTNPNLKPTPITCLVYIGLPTNAQFLRDAADREPAAVAEVISKSRGQSGENREYLYLLERALEDEGFGGGVGLGVGNGADKHVADLARRVREIEAAEGRGDGVEKEMEKGVRVGEMGEFEGEGVDGEGEV
ncbi:hypothetical protein FQN50_009921 [Emmonsiellopsis sp. PD_5]|nr:hypothetical protein FQN50_009921 [Emmonsiellopsis sp. PD_5]